LYSDSRSAAARAAARRAVARFPGHDSRGLRHAAPLGVGTLAARMGPAHQKSDRRTSSDALLGFSRRRGKYAARSMAWQEQLGIAAAAAVALQRFAAAQICILNLRSSLNFILPKSTVLEYTKFKSQMVISGRA
jgi:hypothetical protein